MKSLFRVFLCTFCLLVLLLAFGREALCRTSPTIEGGYRCVTSGDFTRYTIKKDGRQLYFTIQGAAASKRLHAAVRTAFASYGFGIAPQPSAADVIVQITLAYAGRASERDIARAVASGYDASVAVTGKSVFGVVADILLVARAVPLAKDETQLKLKNISQRLALASSTIRIGCVDPSLGASQLNAAFATRFANSVSNKVMQAIAPYR